MLKNTTTSYGSVAKAFHWLLFLLLVPAIIMGNLLAAMPKGAEKLEAASMHKSFGIILLTLILLRFLWRLLNETPKPTDGITLGQARLAQSMHWFLYILMFAQPISGIMMSQSAGFSINFFGFFELPTVLDKNTDLAKFFHAMHGTVWILLVITVVGHAGAGLYHHFVRKDDVLKRMIRGN